VITLQYKREGVLVEGVLVEGVLVEVQNVETNLHVCCARSSEYALGMVQKGKNHVFTKQS
jgi:hypothetical protein